MRVRRLALAGALALAPLSLVSGSSSAAPDPAPPALFKSVRGPVPTLPGVAAAARIDIDAALLTPGRSVTVTLPAPGRQDVARLQPVASDGDFAHWTGTLDGVAHSQVTAVRRGETVVVLVTSPTGSYQLTTRDNGAQVLSHTAALTGPEDEVLTPPAHARDAVTDQVQRLALADAAGDLALADTSARIDIFVGGTPHGVAAAGGSTAFRALAEASVAQTNDALATSQVGTRLRLVGTRASTGTEVDNGTTLRQLQDTTDGRWDDVSSAGVRAGADLTWLLTDGQDSCGVAFYPGGRDWAYGVVSQGCATGNLSFAHEVGHALGASHDPYAINSTGEAPPLVSYGRGYVNRSQRWRTVMAYNNSCGDQGYYCERLPVFSTPLLTLDGVPVGTSSQDNRRAVLAYSSTVAGYRTPPRVSSTYPSSGADGTSRSGSIRVTFNEAVTGVSTRTFRLTTESGALVPARVVKSSALRNTWFLDPDTTLRSDHTHRVQLLGGTASIRDLVGTPLASRSWSFTTGPRPTVTNRTPNPGQTGVGASTRVIVKFSEPVRGASTSTMVVTEPGGQAVPATVLRGSSSAQWIIDPTADLLRDTTYTVRLRGGPTRLRDGADNGLVSTSWTFHTT